MALSRATDGWMAGKYRPFAIIGQGGMAEVFLAVARGPMGFNKIVVVKRLREHLAKEDAAMVRMFVDEAKLAARLTHTNIVQTYEIGEEHGNFFIIMEFLDGQSLRGLGVALDAARQKLPLPIALRILHDLLSGLHYAHEFTDYGGQPVGIVHRDVTPHNVFLTYEGVTKVLDFGIAKAALNTAQTGTGVVKGKVGYLSPEQAGGDVVDRRSDIFSAGIVLWELVTGRRLYPTDLGSFPKVVAEEPPLPSSVAPEVDPELDAITQRALRLPAADRYETAEAMRAALQQYAESHGGMATVAETGQFASMLFASERADVRARIEAELVQTSASRPIDSAALPTIRLGAASGSGSIQNPPTRSLKPRRRRRLYSVGAAALAIVTLLLWVGRAWMNRRNDTAPPSSSYPDEANVRGVTNTEILMGMSAAFTGPAKELGRGMKVGVETYFDEVNDEGGVFGRHVTLVTHDDGYETDRALPAMKELIEQDKVFAIIGNVGTPTAQVAAPYAVSQRTLFYGAFSGASILRHDPPDRYVINYRASYIEETSKAVIYMVDQLKLPPSSIVAFTQNDAFGDAGFDGVAKGLHKFGVDKVNILHTRYQRNTSDVEAAVAQVLEYHRATNSRAAALHPVRGIIMMGTYRPLAKFVRLVKDANINAVFDTVSFVGSDALAEEFSQLGASYGEGVIVTQVVPLPRSAATAAIAYRQSLKKYFRDERPGFVSFEGYLAAKVYVEALKHAGPHVTTEKLIDAFEGIHNLDIGTGGPITFGPSEHQGSHKVWGTMLDGNLNYQILDME
jgi:serine/threonine protein kinase/ABC-type branched-subunit amino acid transport system substrate-binding protein